MPSSRLYTRSATLITWTICLLSTQSFAQDSIDPERTGLIYSIGTVEQVINRTAVIDLGDAHTLRREEQVAVIRPVRNFYQPIGVLRVAETFPTFCQTHPSTLVTARRGDIVIFVREFSQMKVPSRYRDSFIQLQILKNAGANGYSTRRRRDTAMTLLNYRRNHPKWEKSKSDVLGFVNGASFDEGGEEEVRHLLNQIDMFRESYRVGQKSLQAAGAEWTAIMNVLHGPTAKAQHEAAQVETEDEFADADSGPTIRDIRRAVSDELFDRQKEEKALLSYIVATALEKSPRKLDLWLRQQAEQSQFPIMADEDVVLDVIRKIIREFREE